jgi:hypothetical protein
VVLAISGNVDVTIDLEDCYARAAADSYLD